MSSVKQNTEHKNHDENSLSTILAKVAKRLDQIDNRISQMNRSRSLSRSHRSRSKSAPKKENKYFGIIVNLLRRLPNALHICDCKIRKTRCPVR